MGKFVIVCALVFVALFDRAAAGTAAAIICVGYLFYTPAPKIVIRTGGGKKRERGRDAPPDY